MSEKNNSENNINDDPIISYVSSIFNTDIVNTFIDSLNEEQKEYIYAFISGFQVALGRKIIGVYSPEYIDGFHLTEDLLKSLFLVIHRIEIEEKKLNFDIVVQLINENKEENN